MATGEAGGVVTAIGSGGGLETAGLFSGGGTAGLSETTRLSRWLSESLGCLEGEQTSQAGSSASLESESPLSSGSESLSR